MNISFCVHRIIWAAAWLMVSTNAAAQADVRAYVDSIQYKIIKVGPTHTNPAIRQWDSAHIVYYDPKSNPGRVLLWLTGTTGTTRNVPVDFFNTALAQGYRVIALSFISVPAVAHVCIGDTVDANPACSEAFRTKRVYGTGDFPFIADQPQDAIVPRFVKLLNWLEQNDPAGHWSHYLTSDGSKPLWKNIAVAGQSQGGGMTAFIAKREKIARAISFSGGWDYATSRDKKIAKWYFNKAATNSKNMYATYHIQEPAAASIKEICSALRIPDAHVFAFDKPLSALTASKVHANPYHVDGIRNTAYREIWSLMLGYGGGAVKGQRKPVKVN